MGDRGWSAEGSVGIGWSEVEPQVKTHLRKACSRAGVVAPYAIEAWQTEWEAPWTWAEGMPPTLSIDSRLAERLSAEDAAIALCLAWAKQLGGWEAISWAAWGRTLATGATVGVAAVARHHLGWEYTLAQWLAGMAVGASMLALPFLPLQLRGMPGRLRTARILLDMVGDPKRTVAALSTFRCAIAGVPGWWRVRYGWGLCDQLDCLYDAVASVADLPRRTWRAWVSDRIVPPDPTSDLNAAFPNL